MDLLTCSYVSVPSSAKQVIGLCTFDLLAGSAVVYVVL